jgi:hypothetical protein
MIRDANLADIATLSDLAGNLRPSPVLRESVSNEYKERRMVKRILLAGTVLTSVILAPMAIGEFDVVASAHASSGAPAEPLPTQVPEPATLSLLAAGAVVMAISRRRRR